jgi:hypothetical protein
MMTDADVTKYVGTDYPVMQYGSTEAVSGSTASKDRLEAEIAEIQKIYDEVWLKFEDELETYRITVAGDHYVTTKLGGFQVVDLINELFYAPENCVVMSVDGPEPKMIINKSYMTTEVSASHPINFSTSAASAVEVTVSEIPYVEISSTGDLSGISHPCIMSINDKFGGSILFAAESGTYSSTYDETAFGQVEIEFIPGASYKDVTFYRNDGPAADSDLIKYSNELKFLGEHLYGMPSKQGTHGLQQKLNSVVFGSTVMASNSSKCNEINDYYRGNNSCDNGEGGEGKNFTTWTAFASSSDLKYAVSGSEAMEEWVNGDDINLLEPYKIAIKTDVTGSLSAGMQFLLDMTVDGVSSHRYTKISDFEYHDPKMATYCKVVLSPDIPTTVERKNIQSSSDFDDLLLADDAAITSFQVIGGATYNTVLYKNQLTAWVGEASVSSLPSDGSYIVTNSNGGTGYFTIFTSENGTDPFAGYTIVSFEDGLPITYKIDVINTENET